MCPCVCVWQSSVKQIIFISRRGVGARSHLRSKLYFNIAYSLSALAPRAGWTLYKLADSSMDYFDRSNARVLCYLVLPHVATSRRRDAARRGAARVGTKWVQVSPTSYPPSESTSASFAPRRPSCAHHHGPLTRELSTRDLSIGFSHS